MCKPSEAAVMPGGWGMRADNRAKTAGTLNSLWDDGMMFVMRGMSGRTPLFNRRFYADGMIQSDAAHEAIHDAYRVLAALPRIRRAHEGRPSFRAAFTVDKESAIETEWRRGICTW